MRPPSAGEDFEDGWRRRAWYESIAGGGLAFLGLVAVGAALVGAAKLQFTSLGAGSSPFRVLNVTVMAGLATLGAPIRIGGLALAAVPLGALLVSGIAISWAARGTGHPRPGAWTPRDQMVGAVRFALVLGILCAGAAAVFRVPEDPVPVSVSPLQAGLLAVVWGLGFGAIGMILRDSPLRSPLRAAIRRALSLPGPWREVLVFPSLAIGGLALGSLVALLAGIIYRLASAPLPAGFSVGDAIAALVFLLAFGPNVLVSISCLAMGAEIAAGAEITAAGERVGPVVEYSLASWGGGPTPFPAYLLLLVPVAAFSLAGFATRAAAAARERAPTHLLAGSALTGVLLGGLCLVSDARLGGGLVSGSGVARIAPDATSVMPFAFGWAFALGLVGWTLHDLIERRKAHGTGDL